MTILLVEDDVDDRILFFEAARDFDPTITFTAASDAAEALTWLRDVNKPLPDFIFLDLRMPGLSGQQCLVEIKKDPRLAPIPVIIFTTSRDVRESIVLKNLGAAHFMSKPVSPDEVYYMISFVLGEQWPAQ
jgi:CheY-like chemotaxis protein